MNSPKNWGLQIDPGVLKTTRKLPREEAGKLLKVINNLRLNPYYGDIEKMKDEENSWRRRVGSYRIFYKIFINKKIILVFGLERRASKTYKIK